MSLTPRIDNLESNIIINGAMDFWQRNNTGATQTLAAIEYNCVDRFGVNRQTSVANSGNLNLTRQTDVPTFAQSGFRFNNSVRIRCNQTYSVATPQFHALEHRIEGTVFQAVRDSKVVFSFWAKSNKLGTYHVSLNNAAGDQYYLLPFVVSQSLVWTKYSFVVDFSQAPGTWMLDNTIGVRIAWVLHATAEKKGAVSTETWFTPSGGIFYPTTQANFMDSTLNDMFITGVMMKPMNEVVSNPENIKFSRAGKSIPEELMLAQRYFEKSYSVDVNPGTVTTGGQQICTATGSSGTGAINMSVGFKTQKRNSPTGIPYNPNSGAANQMRSNLPADLTASMAGISDWGFYIRNDTSVSTGAVCFAHWTADAEL